MHNKAQGRLLTKHTFNPQPKLSDVYSVHVSLDRPDVLGPFIDGLVNGGEHVIIGSDCGVFCLLFTSSASFAFTFSYFSVHSLDGHGLVHHPIH
jgi:hypothetical protein